MIAPDHLDPMELITDAERALARNWRALLIFALLGALAMAGNRYLVNVLEAAVPDTVIPKPGWYLTTGFFIDLGLAGFIAALQAIMFAQLGADIDRPLWKCSGPREAVLRFTRIWLILNLLYFALNRVSEHFYNNDMTSASASIFVIGLFWTIFYIPVGICLMHNGGARKIELPDALMPMLHFLPQSLLAGVLGLLQLVLFGLIITSFPESAQKTPWVAALANLPLIYLECLAAAIMWILCVRYREYAAEHRDDDLDF